MFDHLEMVQTSIYSIPTPQKKSHTKTAKTDDSCGSSGIPVVFKPHIDYIVIRRLPGSQMFPADTIGHFFGSEEERKTCPEDCEVPGVGPGPLDHGVLGGSRCDDVPCQDVTPNETSKNGAHPNSSHARRKVVAVQHPKNEAEALGKLVRNILVSNSNLLDVIHWMSNYLMDVYDNINTQ